MAEPRRNDSELTTSDLAGVGTLTEEQPARPELVQGSRQTSTPALPQETFTPLFTDDQLNDFRSRWSATQIGFVDEPRKTVEEADKLVATLMTKLAEGFSTERTRLEKQWDNGDKVSTEDLRLALQRYRSFFDRLLKV